MNEMPTKQATSKKETTEKQNENVTNFKFVF